MLALAKLGPFEMAGLAAVLGRLRDERGLPDGRLAPKAGGASEEFALRGEAVPLVEWVE